METREMIIMSFDFHARTEGKISMNKRGSDLPTLP